MRARLVNENMDFERGKDPKDAMDIGINRILKTGDNIQIYLRGYQQYRTEIKDGIYDALVMQDEIYDPSYRRVYVNIPNLDRYYSYIQDKIR